MPSNEKKHIPIYVALLHHSMRDKNGEIVTTAVTNLDIHDIARSSRTYGIKKFFLVNPIKEQQDVIARIISHWNGPAGRDYNPDRSEAFSIVEVSSWLKDALFTIKKLEGKKPLCIMTSARKLEQKEISWEKLRKEIETEQLVPRLLVFGTGWGISEDLLNEADFLLSPILPNLESGYNHLSVRAAVAIALDRLLGEA